MSDDPLESQERLIEEATRRREEARRAAEARERDGRAEAAEKRDQAEQLAAARALLRAEAAAAAAEALAVGHEPSAPRVRLRLWRRARCWEIDELQKVLSTRRESNASGARTTYGRAVLLLATDGRLILRRDRSTPTWTVARHRPSRLPNLRSPSLTDVKRLRAAIATFLVTVRDQ